MASAPGSRGLLDTSTVIILPQLTDRNVVPFEPLISAVTLAELAAGPLAARTALERERRQVELATALAQFEVIPFDSAAAQAFAHVSASLRRSGRTTSARAYDALIAATAIAHNLPIYTCNPSDFTGIEGLKVVAVPLPT